VYQSALFNNKTVTYLITNNASSIEKFVKKDSKKNRKTIFVDKSILPISIETVIAKNSVYYGNFTENDLQVNSIEDKYISKIFHTILGFLTKSQYQENT
jgi:hypothetical protein